MPELEMLKLAVWIFAKAAEGRDGDGIPLFLGSLNWGSEEVTRAQFEEWWDRFRATEGAARRARAAETERLRITARAKLTPAERRAVGL